MLLFPLPSEGFAPTNLVLRTPPWTWLFVNCNPQFSAGACRIAIAVDARRPFNWLNSFMEAVDFPNRSWNRFTIFFFFWKGQGHVF